MNDTEYMRLALELAKKGCGWTSPNPMVGAVIVKDGQIIGQGWHERYGQPHAERNALASCAVDPEGATMYVTLAPSLSIYRLPFRVGAAVRKNGRDLFCCCDHLCLQWCPQLSIADDANWVFSVLHVAGQ